MGDDDDMMTLQDVHERNTAYNSPHIDLKIVISGLRDTMVVIRKLLWALLLLPVGGYRLLQMKLQPDNFIKKLAAGAMGLGLLLPNANAMESPKTKWNPNRIQPNHTQPNLN